MTKQVKTAVGPVEIELHYHQHDREPAPRRSVYVRLGALTIHGKAYMSVSAHQEEYPARVWGEDGEGLAEHKMVWAGVTVYALPAMTDKARAKVRDAATEAIATVRDRDWAVALVEYREADLERARDLMTEARLVKEAAEGTLRSALAAVAAFDDPGEQGEPPLCACGQSYVGHADHAEEA